MTRARDLADFNLDGKAVTINESSADLDFRVEGNGNANAFFVQGSDDFIGIGTGAPKKKLHIQDTTSDGIIILDMNGTTTDHQICFAKNYQSGGQSGGNYYAIGVDGSENKLVFAFDANAQASLSADAKVTLDSGGDLTINEGDLVIGTSGHGISFAATANSSGSMGNELLDDYEEGTFTATLEGSTTNPSSTVQTTSARYTKVGRLVFVQGQFSNVDTTGASGAPRVTGLPFGAATSYATGNVMTYNRFTLGTTASNVSPYVAGSTIFFYQSTNQTGWAEIAHSAGSGAYLAFTATYET